MSITICSAARNRFRDRLRRHKGGLFRGHYVCACPDWENERGEHLLSRKTLAQDRQHAFGVDDIVERYDRIVGELGKGAFPFEARPHLDLEPFVQHIVALFWLVEAVQAMRGYRLINAASLVSE